MNVIRQTKRGGGVAKPGGGPSRPIAAAPPKSKGRGRGALDFDLIQYRPGQRRVMSSSSSGTTPSNLQLQMAISSSAHRTSSSSGNNYSSPLFPHGSTHPSRRITNNPRILSASASMGTASSSTVTPRFGSMAPPPPKTPRGPVTPKNSLIVSGTPRTTPSTSTGCDPHSHVVLALTEGRGHARGEVGIAVIDIKRPRLILCQLSDRQTYVNTLTKISVFRPVEILIPHTFVESNQPNKLYNLLEENFPFVSMSKVQRRLFRDSEGLERVQNLCLPEYSSCQLILQERFYALSAANALLKYVEFVQNVIFSKHSLKVEYQGAHHGTVIDFKTAKNLELLLNQQSNNTRHTLVGMMDHCCTHGGSRLLRASLLHPPCSLPNITRRQDGVQELVEHPDTAQKIREVLQQLPDVEQLLTLCMQTPSTIDNSSAMESRVNYVLMLKTTLEALPLLFASLENAQSILLSKARETLKDSRIEMMKKRISETINEDVKAPKGGKTASFQRCFAVKTGINELMDVARKTYCELINDMNDHMQDLASNHSLPLKLNYSVTKGYHIQITVQKTNPIKKSDIPSKFVQVQQSRNSLTCTTSILIHANERIKQVADDILLMSNRILADVVSDIREHIAYLYDMCESIAETDLILALAQISCSHNYVRPQFGDVLSLKRSRHPILESITTCEPTANDIEASSFQNLTVVTGPNMSGKSIYIRQLLLLQIMAQVGSYIPADQATFRITDRIFSHLNFDDSIENNASTLALEMQEMQLVFSSITATSLVALDELCRGTSVEEGTALAWAMCEELSQSTAFVFVTTHFRELTRLASMYPCVRNVHLETVENVFSDKKSRLVYTHRLCPGANPVEGYGLRLAENLNVPEDILERAKHFASQIQNTSEVNFTSATGNEMYCLVRSFHRLSSLVMKEDLCVDDLILEQSALKEELHQAKQRKVVAHTNRKISPMPQNSSKRNDSHTHVNKQNLCDYSSSDQDSPLVGAVPKQIMLKPVTSDSPLSGSTGSLTSGAVMPAASKSGFSSYLDSDSAELDTVQSVSDDDDDDSASTSFLGNADHEVPISSPMSSVSCFSNQTWLLETPRGQSSNISEDLKDRRLENDDAASVVDYDSDVEQSSFVSESFLSDGASSSRFSHNMSVSRGEPFCDELTPFSVNSKEKSPVESTQINDHPSLDFFQFSGSQNSTKPHPFEFICTNQVEKERNFEALFKTVEAGVPTPNKGAMQDISNAVVLGRKRPVELDEEMFSPIFKSKIHRKNIAPNKKEFIFAPESMNHKDHANSASHRPVQEISPALERDKASPVLPSVQPIRVQGTGLQVLMESYRDSDSDSD